MVLPHLLFALFIAAGFGVFSGAWWGKTLGAGIAVFALVLHFPLCDYRNHFFVYDYGRSILAQAGPRSILYDPDDPTAFTTAYLQIVEKRRPDVTRAAFFRTRWGYELLKKYHPEILPPYEVASGQDLARVILDYNKGRVPVYADLPGKFPGNNASYPQGLLYRLSAGEYAPSGRSFALDRRHGEYHGLPDYDFFTSHIISYSAAAHTNLGMAYASQGRYDEARKEYLAALSLDPELLAACNNLGTLAFYRKDYAQAQKWFEVAVRKDPGNPSSVYNLGLAEKALGKTSEAKAHFIDAWENHRYPDAGNELGLQSLASGNTAEAAGIFSGIVRSAPQYLPAYYNLGLSLERLGRNDEARRAFEIYLQHTPDPVERREVAARLDRLSK